MLYACRLCAQLYDADEEREDKLCPACAQMQTPEEPEDYRAPLYACACSLSARFMTADYDRLCEMFTMLGDYRDCPDRLEGLHLRAQKELEWAQRTLQVKKAAPSELEEAAAHLRALGSYPGAQQALAVAEQRLEARRKKDLLMRVQQKSDDHDRAVGRVCKLLALGAAIVAMCMLVYMLVVVPDRLRQAETALAHERFGDAYALFEDSRVLGHRGAAQSGMRRTRYAVADRFIIAGQYADAIDIYDEYRDYDRKVETYRLWSDALVEKGDVAGAIAVLRKSPDKAACAQRIETLARQQASLAAADVFLHDAQGGHDAEYARAQGSAINALDAQLLFCGMLADAGYDLSAVYPDGVEVIDAELAAYQFDGEDDGSGNVDMSRVLVFSRRHQIVSFSDGDGFNAPAMYWSMPNRTYQDAYVVRLYPGLMYGRAGLTPAASREEATAFLIADRVYEDAGEVPELDSSLLRCYNTVSSVALYDAANPERRQIFSLARSEPPYADSTWRSKYAGNTLTLLSTNARLGTFESESDLLSRLSGALDQLFPSQGR